MILNLPEMVQIPPKLLPLITEFNNYKFFVIEGGRGSAKTQSVARVLEWIASLRKVRIFCGREVMNTIDESVYTVLTDLIERYALAFRVRKNALMHYKTKSFFRFKGFREQGKVNIKGVEGADIIWIDEAQTITKATLDVLIPTLRKENGKVIFTMNRHMRNDAVIEELVGRPDCLHIKINYFENPHCPLTLKNEAEIVKNKNIRDYRHIWLGEPISASGEYLYNFDKLYAAQEISAQGDLYIRQRVLAIDFAAQGDDSCVASILDRLDNQRWQLTEQVVWQEPDGMVSTGKIVELIGIYKPDLTAMDVGGMGHIVHNRLTEIGMEVLRFDGGEGASDKAYGNTRAEAYYLSREWFDNGFIRVPKECVTVLKQAENIKMKWRSNGQRLIQSKIDMKKAPPIGVGESPDELDSVVIGIWAIHFHLGKMANALAPASTTIRRISTSRRR